MIYKHFPLNYITIKRKVLIGHFKIQRCDPPKIAHVCLEERMHAYRKMCKTKLKTTDVEENRDMVRFYIMITVKKMTKIYHHPLFM